MIVKELIEALKCQPLDNKVYLYATYSDGRGVAYGEVQFVERDEYHNPGITSLWTEEG